MELLETHRSERGVMAEAFDAQQGSVGSEADRLEILHVIQPAADAEVEGEVDGRLGAQCTALLEVLLDARGLVVAVQRGGHPVGDHPGAEARWRALGHAPPEYQLDVVRAPEVEVLADHLLQ